MNDFRVFIIFAIFFHPALSFAEEYSKKDYADFKNQKDYAELLYKLKCKENWRPGCSLKHKFIGQEETDPKYIHYKEALHSKIQRVGNINYPEEARKMRLSGEVVMDIALKQDGSIMEITILSSSGRKILDEASLRIVELSSPFASFPNNIKDEVDIIHFIANWNYINS